MTLVTKTAEIDATGQTLGRLASGVAAKLRGKNLVAFAPNKNLNSKVRVFNLSSARFTGTKLTTKKYYKYSGYPGGMKVTSLEQEFIKNPVRLFTNMVRLMLPKNRLAKQLIKNLTVDLGNK